MVGFMLWLPKERRLQFLVFLVFPGLNQHKSLPQRPRGKGSQSRRRGWLTRRGWRVTSAWPRMVLPPLLVSAPRPPQPNPSPRLISPVYWGSLGCRAPREVAQRDLCLIPQTNIHPLRLQVPFALALGTRTLFSHLRTGPEGRDSGRKINNLKLRDSLPCAGLCLSTSHVLYTCPNNPMK